ncbi:hypothetical protein JZ751_001266 [Albula glossodonta]|uniref:Fibrinogen C-terminal domain-containing protein n=1 Tax=Albula glossodonta TaxID=121402 RepID=A0A8T2PT82_9TELE|nr:hypothetical protein JZ751_001266 [Albula glossodonta]
MNSASELGDGAHRKHKWMSCTCVLCTTLLFVILLAGAVTGTILFMNNYQATLMPDGPPLINTNQAEGNPLVTIERGDGSRINIFVDPNCPDYEKSFMRLEGVQTTLLHSLADHDSDHKGRKVEDRVLLTNLKDQLAKLSAHASQLKMDYDSLWRGQGNLGQEINTLQTEQGRLIQLLSESQVNMVKVVNSVKETLTSLQRDTGSIKTRLRADVQRAPIRSPRPKACGNGSRPRDCLDIYINGQREDGIYSIFPTHHPSGFQVIQRREDGSVSFFREWDAYRKGFGKITGEHWLGMRQIHALTIQANYELRIDLEDFENNTAFAQYGTFGVGLFSVDPDDDGYPLTITDYTGTAGDSLLKHNGMKFTTKDRDNDHSENNCASFYHGAWWYRNCHTSNLNGQYLNGQHTSYADGIEWSSWTGWQYSLKFTEMKIRPTREENK